MDLAVYSFVNSEFCSTFSGDERCPEIVEAILRNGLPLLAAAATDDDFAQVSKEQNIINSN